MPEALPSNPVAPGPQGPSVLLTWVGDERTIVYRIPLETAKKIRDAMIAARSGYVNDEYPVEVNQLLAEGTEVETLGIVRTDENWGWYESDNPYTHVTA